MTACVLIELIMPAYKHVNAEHITHDSVTFKYLINWCKERESSRPQFNFWRSIMN